MLKSIDLQLGFRTDPNKIVLELYAPDWELIFYVPIVNLSQSSKVGRIAIANNVTNENIATSVLLPTTPTKPIFLIPIPK